MANVLTRYALKKRTTAEKVVLLKLTYLKMIPAINAVGRRLDEDDILRDDTGDVIRCECLVSGCGATDYTCACCDG